MNLAGKDYFTIAEAAHYCCVSESHFRRNVRAAGLLPGKLWGKLIYRRSDLARLIEQQIEWPQPPSTMGTHWSGSKNLRPRSDGTSPGGDVKLTRRQNATHSDDPLDRFRRRK
jgi:hypothetical protein